MPDQSQLLKLLIDSGPLGIAVAFVSVVSYFFFKEYKAQALRFEEKMEGVLCSHKDALQVKDQEHNRVMEKLVEVIEANTAAGTQLRTMIDDMRDTLNAKR